jgi:DNA helicase II / ATP-dependent DNA helicase PcrA
VFDWLERLNEQQQAAVTHDGGPLLILAGAGTGKTTTLTSRLAWLVAQGVPAERILLLTFTRRAAREMVDRTQALFADRRRAARVRGGTFHAVGLGVLRAHAGVLGLPEGFGVLDPSDAVDLLDLVRSDAGVAARGRRFPRASTLLDVYSRAVNAQRTVSDILPEIAPWCATDAEDIADVLRAFVARKRACGVLDFDDLLLLWRAAVRDEALGPLLEERVDHVLVDEYQDVNALQVDIVSGLRARDKRVTVVGDDAQAIYGFRSADPRHILEFDRVFPGASVVTLERNYRSTQPILDVANLVAAQATERHVKTLHAVNSGRVLPQLVICADEQRQTGEVCTRILAEYERGVRLRAQAVLVRAAHHSDLLELELGLRRIPYVKYGGMRFLEAAHVKDLVCAFRLADNPGDETSWFRLLPRLDGVGPTTARRVIAALGIPGEPAPLDRWAQAAALLPESAQAAADVLLAALRQLPGELPGLQAQRLRDAVAPLVVARYADAAARLADLDQLVAAAANAGCLSDVAAELLLEAPAATGDLAGPPSIDDDYLVISTAHSAKGLEWDVVHVLHAADGNFPSDMSLTSEAGLEEERRLFYVALTRARRLLHVYAPLRYHHRPRGRDDVHNLAQLSRFLTPTVQAAFDVLHASHAPVRREVGVGVTSAGRVDAALQDLLR